MPAWFAKRMMFDNWSFGLLMTDGTWIGIECIENITLDANGNVWLDVRLIEEEHARRLADECGLPRLVCAPTSRNTASIQAAHVMMAVELADT
jgi:hypothetical protein